MANIYLENFEGLQLLNNRTDEQTVKYNCQLCGNLMKQPVQTYRGNAACSKCYHEAFVRSGSVNCPIDKTPITPRELFNDKAREKEIFNLECFCINRSRGCPWTGNILDLQKRHDCEFNPKNCHLCNKMYPKGNEIFHRTTECPALIKEGECFYNQFGCTFKTDTTEKMAKHLTENLDNHSMYEDHYVKYEEMENNYKAVLRDNNQLKSTVDTLEKKVAKTEEDTRKQVAQLTEALFELSAKVHGGAKDTASEPVLRGGSDVIMSHDDNKPVVMDAEMQRQITLMKNGVKCNSANLSDMDLRFQLHENTTYDGHLLWKIADFNNRSQQAIIGKTRALHCAPCFTSKYGYKYCLRLYLNGDGMGKGTHLSLFLVIMKSEYDSVLEWPFQKIVKFTLINQQNRSLDYVERMTPNRDSSSFQKPKKDMNIASGCPFFFNLGKLEPEGFVKDNALFIDVKLQ